MVPHTSDPGHLPGLSKFPWRFAVYGVAVLYLAGDLYVFNGPLKQRIDVMRGQTPDAADLARDENIVATANGYPIRRNELQLAISEYCLRRGIDESTLDRKRRNRIQVLIRNELIIDRLLWFHTDAAPVDVPDSVKAAVREDFRAGFTSDEEMLAAARARGFSKERLDAFLDSQAHQQVWVETKIAPHIVVTEAEARARYEELGEEAGASFEQMRDELEAMIEAEKRQWAVDGLIDHLQRKAVRRNVADGFWDE
jgi:hypothetical protein